MLSQFSYPIVCSDKFEQTVAFYEDYFDFVPEFEMKGFVILKREGKSDSYLAIIDSRHGALPEEHKRPVQGMLLNYPVDNALKFYDYAYHEGLTLKSEPKDMMCGRKHFYVEDPNGILVDVAEHIDIAAIIANEDCADIRVMQQQA